MTTKAARLDRWIWPLVYGGIVLAGIGLTAWTADGGIGESLTVLGGALVAAGALLIWLRSRIKDPEPTPAKEPTR